MESMLTVSLPGQPHDVADSLRSLALIRRMAKELKALENAHQAFVIEHADADATQVAAGGVTAKVIRSKERVFDLDALTSLVDTHTLDEVTIRKVSTPAFNRAVSLGMIPTEVVRKVVSVKERAPYVKDINTDENTGGAGL